MEVKISDLLPDADISGLPAPVQADPDRVREAVMGKLKEEHMQTTKRTRKIRRTLVLAVAAAALLGVTALAAAMGGFDWLRETVDPPMLDAVEEQGQSVTSNGIKLNVIAAQKYGDAALLYVSIQDTTGQGRVTEQTHPLWGGLLTGGHHTMLYYDSATSTAVYQLRFSSLDELCLYKLLYSPSRLDGARVDADLADLYLNGEQIPGTVDPRTTPPEWLTTGYLADIPGGEGSYVSAIGMNCGYFTVQYRYPGVDKECYMGAYLLDGNGQRIDSIPGGTSTLDDGDGMATTERYFKVDAETLENCTLCFEGSIYDVAHGDWEIDIDFESTQGVRLLTADIEFDGVTARDTEMILSPIGLELTREYDAGSHMLDTDVVLETTSGDIKLRSCGSEWASTDMSTWNTFFEAHEPIDVSSVTAIRIGDTRLELE